jgi:sugar lactone lactonase YvrE
MGNYCPGGCAVDEERYGGNGDIWVADGYGSSIVYRFDKEGNQLTTLTGDEGGGRFLCPHSVYIDRRPGKDVELYIADRENRRVQVYDLTGHYVRTVGESFLSSPSGFAQWGDFLVIAELYSRLALLDNQDNLVGYIGDNTPPGEIHTWPNRPGWPNALDWNGRAVAAAHDLDADQLNSPHSLAVDADGNLYVSEWLIGGCYTSLRPHP